MNEPAIQPRSRRAAAVTAILIAAAVFIVGVAVLLTGLLITRRRDFQNASDHRFVKAWLSETTDATLYETALPYLRDVITPYEDEEAAKALLRDSLTADGITFARAEGYTAEAPVYTLFAEGREAFRLTLVNTGNGPAGHPRWAVESLALSPSCDLGQPLTLEVPKGAAVTVNGTPLDPAAAENVPYHALSEFEASLSEAVACDRYAIGRFFAEPTVEVTLDGQTLRADSLAEGVLRYSYPISYTTAISLTVPYGSAITVNGIPLSGQYQTASGVPYPFLTRFEADLPNVMTAVVYQVSGLFQKSTVEVICGSEVLTEVEDGVYRLPEDQTKTVTVCAPNYATVKLNGVSLGVTEIYGVRYDLPILEGVTTYVKERPLMVRYQVSGLLADPVITATDEQGSALSLNPYFTTEEETVFAGTNFGVVPDKELLTLRTFAKSYITYMYSGTSKLTTHYNAVISMAPAKSPAYQMLKAAYKELYSTDIHTSIKYGEIEAVHYTIFDDNAYAAVMKIPFTSKLNGEKLSHTVTMEILYVYSGNIRRIVNYRVLETVSETVN